MLFLILLVLCLTAVLILRFFRKPVFGRLPSGSRQARIEQSVHYRDGQFHFPEPTPMQAEGVHMLTLLRKFLFTPRPDAKPALPIPMQAAAWREPVPEAALAVTWFGHSSYLLQWPELNVLVDPVFSERTSPVQYAGTKAFGGTHIDIEALPDIDILLITHDHYDHLDYLTMKRIRNRVKQVYVPLGIGAHLERWGFDPARITELDWWQQAFLPGGGTLTATPARHYTGRGFVRNKALWASFVLEFEGKQLLVGGDSGYGPHFRAIRERFGAFDLAILECGQYNEMWPYIHMMPEETVQAARDLDASLLFPVHWGKFALAMHPWREPAERVLREAERLAQPLFLPLPGSRVLLGPGNTTPWWQSL